MGEYILEIAYLIASVLYIFGLKMMSGPKTARNGNLWAAAGMFIAIVATIFLYKDGSGNHLTNLPWIGGGIAIGTILGYMMAKKVQMTDMPQMVSLFNGMGGACAAIIGIIEFPHYAHDSNSSFLILLTIYAGLVIGSTSFAGSMVAFLKLNGNLKKDIRLPFYNILNTGLIIAAIGLTICLAGGHIHANIDMWVYILLGLSLSYGILFVLPIGGADMPVVISLLNSFTGMAAALGGFLYGNMAMLTGGILVGSAGTILTVVMCKGMNRSLTAVIFGAFGTGGAAVVAGGGDGTQKSYKQTNPSDLAVLLNYSSKVIIVPGYGLAVAQAQHVVNEMENILTSRGVEVKYAIHPVAGRMPGHMNVLLAEADVPYEQVIEMDDINSEFSQTDLVLVIGANDVVNPAAKTPGSPIYGMPILEAEKAKMIVVNKRSMAPGYAGLDNELFYLDKTMMLFGDAKKVVEDLVKAI